jgi:hypothetical protein
MTRLVWLGLLAFPLSTFDAATEVAQLREAMKRAHAPKDAAAFVKVPRLEPIRCDSFRCGQRSQGQPYRQRSFPGLGNTDCLTQHGHRFGPQALDSTRFEYQRLVWRAVRE